MCEWTASGGGGTGLHRARGSPTWAPMTANVPAAWRREGLLAHVAEIAGLDDRRAALRDLAATALSVPPDRVRIVHREGEAPRLVAPSGRVLHLSGASRGGWAALAAAAGPVGIDIETVEPAADLPEKVLHPDEVLALRRLSGHDRPRAFARLWTVKEAYLKALGIGLAREPASFRVRLVDARLAEIDDEVAGGAAPAESRWFGPRVVSLVLLPAR